MLGRAWLRPLGGGSHLSDDLAEVDGGAGCHDESVGGGWMSQAAGVLGLRAPERVVTGAGGAGANGLARSCLPCRRVCCRQDDL